MKRSWNSARGSARVPLLFILLWLGLFAPRAEATIHYRVSLAARSQNQFRVEVEIPNARAPFEVQLPAWNALYQIRDFAQRVSEFRATDAAGQPLAVEKQDKQTWRITPRGAGAVRVTYNIEWNDGGPFSSQLNSEHAFLNPATALVYLPARRSEDVTIVFRDVPEGWRAAAALPAGTEPFSFAAGNYDLLADAPMEVSKFDDWSFEATSPAGTARVRVVLHGEGAFNAAAKERLTDKLRRIVSYQTGLMREIPFREFLFIYNIGAAVGGGGGGMEHANSTAIGGGSLDAIEGVSSHEFFHLWNVKRIRPQTLEPVDYTRENWTRALWFAEGVTSTYGDYTLLRSGIWTPQQWMADLAGQIAQLEARPARTWKSVEEASLDAWFEKYPSYRRPAYSISYYNKGQILGVLLDIVIRDASNNRRSLDDVLRDLNARFAKKGLPYDERRDLQAAAERAAGRGLEDFFARYVRGTDELPYAEILARAGMKLAPREDRGYRLVDDLGAGEKQRRIREGLLRGSTDTAGGGKAGENE